MIVDVLRENIKSMVVAFTLFDPYSFLLPYQGPRNGFQLTGAQSAISAGGGCLNQAPSPWPQIGPKLTGAWHPLLKIDGCTGTRGTRSYEDPGAEHLRYKQ